MRQMFRLVSSLFFLLILTAALFAFAMFQGGFVSWFLFYSYLPIATYQLLFIFYPIRTFGISRDMPVHRLQRGESVDITIQISRKFPFPLSYSICEDILPESLRVRENLEQRQKDDIKKVFLFHFRKTIDVPYTLSSLPRGEHRLRAVRIRTGDLFGWVKKEYVFSVEDKLSVYPRVKQVNQLRQLADAEGGNTLVTTRETGNSVSGIREYIPGDRIGFIDWKQSAKKNELMTKEFEQENEKKVHLILNRCSVPDEKVLTFETAVELVNSLTQKWLRESIPFTFLSIGEEMTHFSMQTATDRRRLNTHLMCVQPEGAGFSLKVKQQTGELSGTVVLVTARLDESYLDLVKTIYQRSGKLVVLYAVRNPDLPSDELALVRQIRREGVIVQLAASGKGLIPPEVRQK
jgi:uncharacterized protein (DUF58 family)